MMVEDFDATPYGQGYDAACMWSNLGFPGDRPSAPAILSPEDAKEWERGFDDSMDDWHEYQWSDI